MPYPRPSHSRKLTILQLTSLSYFVHFFWVLVPLRLQNTHLFHSSNVKLAASRLMTPPIDRSLRHRHQRKPPNSSSLSPKHKVEELARCTFLAQEHAVKRFHSTQRTQTTSKTTKLNKPNNIKQHQTPKNCLKNPKKHKKTNLSESGTPQRDSVKRKAGALAAQCFFTTMHKPYLLPIQKRLNMHLNVNPKAIFKK